MGDNGFQFGEHGLIDKRTAYKTSIRIPLIVMCPGRFREGSRISQIVANIDIAPTILELAGIEPPKRMDGKSFVPLLLGEQSPWRDELLYEYYWERNYPQTPTNHAILTDRYKFIRYHGIWDMDELYDMRSDPDETRNLINNPTHQDLAKHLRKRLFGLLRQTHCSSLPLQPDRGSWFPWRLQDSTESADFPEAFFQATQP